jgi:hypothetical protein
MTRRWAPSNITLSTTRYRVVQGIKSPDDLRLERFDNGRWMPVFMEEVFLNPYRPYWRESGGTYFLKEVIDAARNGWTAPTSRLRENRRRKEAS